MTETVDSIVANLNRTHRIVPREPSPEMLNQGAMYLPGVDRDALTAAWRIMVDMAQKELPRV